MIRSIIMDSRDNVATLLDDAKAGDKVSIFDSNNACSDEIEAICSIPFGNKIALAPIEKGDMIVKYGANVGVVTKDIEKGSLVHVHNVTSLSVDLPLSIKTEIMRQLGYDMEGKAL